MKKISLFILCASALHIQAQRTIWPPVVDFEVESSNLILNPSIGYFLSEQVLENEDILLKVERTNIDREGDWMSVQSFESKINTSVVGISKDADTLYLLGTYSKANPSLKGLSFSFFKDGFWSDPIRLKVKGLSSRTPFYNIYVHPSGEWCAISLEKSKKQSDDVFISFKNKSGGYFEKPVPLNQAINSPNSEITPFITHDGEFLFFARANISEDSLNYDIYMSRAMDRSLINWSTPVPLLEINSAGYDGNYWCCKDSFAFYTSIDDSGRFRIYTTLAPRVLRHNSLVPDKANVRRLANTANDRIELPSILKTYKVEIPKTSALIPKASFKSENPIYNVNAKINLGDSSSSDAGDILVQANDENGNVLAVTRTDSLGNFSFENLPVNQKVVFAVPENNSDSIKVGLINENGEEEEPMLIASFSNFIFKELEIETATIKLLDQADDSSMEKYLAGTLDELILTVEDEEGLEFFSSVKLIEGILMDTVANEIIRNLDSLVIIDKNSQDAIKTEVLSDSTFDLSQLDSAKKYLFIHSGKQMTDVTVIALEDHLISTLNERTVTNETIFDSEIASSGRDSSASETMQLSNVVILDNVVASVNPNNSLDPNENIISDLIDDGSGLSDSKKHSLISSTEDTMGIAKISVAQSISDVREALEIEDSSVVEMGMHEFNLNRNLMNEGVENQSSLTEISEAEVNAKALSGFNELPSSQFDIRLPINLKYPTSYEDFIQSDGSYAQIIQIDEGVNYHFDFNQIYISNAQLEYIIETIRPFYDENKAISLTLEGHTDSIGSVEINERVGVMRASQVLYALENAGIEDADLKIISRGELDPIGSNSKPEGRAMNRRVEILYELQEDKLSK
jgi:outer membrane protein OmpA-like peptidoglycan-associated protein